MVENPEKLVGVTITFKYKVLVKTMFEFAGVAITKLFCEELYNKLLGDEVGEVIVPPKLVYVVEVACNRRTSSAITIGEISNN